MTDAAEPTCSHCRTAGLETGLLLDEGYNTVHPLTWLPGPAEVSMWGNIKRGRRTLAVAAYRCPSCGHLELFAPE